MALVPKFYSVNQIFLSSATVTEEMVVVDITGKSGIFGALALAPIRGNSSSIVEWHTITLTIDGEEIINTSNKDTVESIMNIFENGNALYFRLPFQNSLRVSVRASRSSTSGPVRATASALVFVEE